MIDPLTKNEKFTSTRERMAYLIVIMAKDKIIYLFTITAPALKII